MDVTITNALTIIAGPAFSAFGGIRLLSHSHFQPTEFFLRSSRVISCSAKILGGISLSIALLGTFANFAVSDLSDPRITYTGMGYCGLGLTCIFYKQVVQVAQCFQKVFYCKAKSGLERQGNYGAVSPISPTEIELA